MSDPRQPYSAPSLPTSFASGRYEVKRFLGEGGKKKVYLAHDTLLDRDVAFALIKTEGLDDASRSRISREAQAMGRLGDHPHITQIYDLGEDDPSPDSGQAPQPYMVLPLMPGGDVDDLIEKAPEYRLPLEQALDIATAVCRGLEFAHIRGIVHRDLKPGCGWLTAKPAPGRTGLWDDKGEVFAISRFRGPEGASERRPWVPQPRTGTLWAARGPLNGLDNHVAWTYHWAKS